jgi:hypothetical protein
MRNTPKRIFSKCLSCDSVDVDEYCSGVVKPGINPRLVVEPGISDTQGSSETVHVGGSDAKAKTMNRCVGEKIDKSTTECSYR